MVNPVAVALADIPVVLAASDDVRVDVEVGEEGEHHQHVARQQVLAPARKVAVDVDAVQGVGQRDEELNLSNRFTEQFASFSPRFRHN